jgi:hypothetical protein
LNSTNDHKKPESDWFIEAKWEYDSVSNTFLFLICSLKIGSNKQVWSDRLTLVLDEPHMSIEKGEITHLSSGTNDSLILNDQQHKRLNELASKIPLPKRTGPEIDVNINLNKQITKHECEGESTIRMTYGTTNTVTTYQDYRSSEDGTFRQHFVITHISFSRKLLEQNGSAPVEKPAFVSHVTVLYQTEDDTWHECEDVAIAPIALRNEEPRWLADSVIDFENDKLISYAIRGWFIVQGDMGKDNATRRRLHKSLPQPFKLKIVTTDNSSKQRSLIVEQLNKPQEFDTSDSFLKYNLSSINDLLAFVYADDCESDERIFMAIYLNKENEVVIKSSHMSSISFDKRHIRTMEFNARQNNTTEVPFDSLYYQHDTQEKKAIALFDPEMFIFYAIRLEVSTKTSKTEQTVLLPLDKLK